MYMLEFFSSGIITWIVGGVIFFNLYSRVRKLEHRIKTGTVKPESKPADVLAQPQQSVNAAQSVVPGPLLDYVKQQLAQGVAREQIVTALIASGWQTSDIASVFSSMPSQQAPAPGSVAAPEPSREPIELGRFGEWLVENWMLKLGALLLLIGFGWFTTYAFLNDWIGPAGRISLGIIAGSMFLMFGWWRMRSYVLQGGVFLVLGSTTILLTIFAARTLYDFFTPFYALAVMFLSTVLVALASVKYGRKPLALASLVLAGIAPLLTGSPTTDSIGLFAYLFVVVLGAIWIVALTGQRELTMAALLLVSFYSITPLKDKETLLLFAYAFSALFFLTNTTGMLKLKGKEVVPDLVTAALNGLFLFLWIAAYAPRELQSLILSAWTIVFIVGAFLIFRVTQSREPFLTYAGIGVALLAAATAIELKGGTALTIAYAIESAVVVLVAYAVSRDIKIAERLMLLLAGPVLLSFRSLDFYAWTRGFVPEHFFALFTVGLTLFSLGLFFRRIAGSTAGPTLLVLGSAYAYILIWLCSHAGHQSGSNEYLIATIASLAVYTIIGLICYFSGLAGEKRGLRLYGGTLVVIVIVRLLLVDAWAMELAGRIATFFLIGAMLISTAFLGKKKQQQI